MLSLAPPPQALLADAALFLDFDGTLVELAETPEAIHVPQSLPRLLGRLRDRLGGRVAVVSGRSVANLEGHLPLNGIPISGSHGLELRLRDGTLVPLHAPSTLKEVRAAVREFADKNNGLLVEEKPAGVALHYRQTPALEGPAICFIENLAGEAGLVVQRGNMVIEVRPHGADKGDAVRALMKEEPFTGAFPLFIGDDLTDEHAFAAVAAMGGAGILVGPQRETAARYGLPSVAAVAEWLEACA